MEKKEREMKEAAAKKAARDAAQLERDQREAAERELLGVKDDAKERGDGQNQNEKKTKKREMTGSSGGYRGRDPTFFIGGGNGVALINGILEDMGWRRITEKQDENFKLKWTELKTCINYATFKEGEQMVNHIPNCQLLTNKMGLLTTLQEYDRQLTNMRKGKPPAMKLNDIIPDTYNLDDTRDRVVFFETAREGDIWICKPTGRNQGKGIYLVRDPKEIRTMVQESEPKQGRPSRPLNRVIQKYITNPLLLDNKKFDIRCYMLIANTVPFLVLYHKGYARLSLYDYDNDTNNLIAHLTNQFIQKKDPQYKESKEETAWSMDRFNDYVNEHLCWAKDLEADWVYNTLTTRMKQIMTYCFNSVKNRLETKVGYFDLYGFDFMVDTDMKIYLIEVNINPCLAINIGALREVVPRVVKETIHVAVECFEKARKGKPLMPLESLDEFEVLFQGPSRPGFSNTRARSRRAESISPTRRSVQAPKGGSPAKDTRDKPTADRSIRINSSSTAAAVKSGSNWQVSSNSGAVKSDSKLTDKPGISRTNSKLTDQSMGNRTHGRKAGSASSAEGNTDKTIERKSTATKKDSAAPVANPVRRTRSMSPVKEVKEPKEGEKSKEKRSNSTTSVEDKEKAKKEKERERSSRRSLVVVKGTTPKATVVTGEPQNSLFGSPNRSSKVLTSSSQGKPPLNPLKKREISIDESPYSSKPNVRLATAPGLKGPRASKPRDREPSNRGS